MSEDGKRAEIDQAYARREAEERRKQTSIHNRLQYERRRSRRANRAEPAKAVGP